MYRTEQKPISGFEELEVIITLDFNEMAIPLIV